MFWRMCFRRVREINENNMKKFVDERRRQDKRHDQLKDALAKAHQDQMELLVHEMNKVSMRSLRYFTWAE